MALVEIVEKAPLFTPFALREVTAENKKLYRSSPSRSILKTPTDFSTPDKVQRTGKKLTFADGSENQREGSADSMDKSEEKPIEVAISPSKSIKVSPEAWKAHQAYRRFTDYANQTVKTDYTYSWLSPFHYREIAPGIPMRPNMSRAPLHSDYGQSLTEIDSPISTQLRYRNIYSSFSAQSRLHLLQKRLNIEPSRKIPQWLWIVFMIIVVACFVLNIFSSTSNVVSQPFELSKKLHSLSSHLRKVEDAIVEEMKRCSDLDKLFFDVERSLQIVPLKASRRMCCAARKLALHHYHAYKQLTDAQEAQSALNRKLSHLRNFVEAELSQQRSGVTEMLRKLRSQMLSSADNSTLYIHSIVQKRLKLYDSDKTALPDYALYSAGGRVVSVRCTQPWPGPKSISFDPTEVIKRSVSPGECWAFQGEGRLVIQLGYPIIITSCSVEHIPLSLHPLGHTKSAPYQFSLWGLRSESDPHPHAFGNYTYKIGEQVDTIQHFPVAYPSTKHFQFVEVIVLSNHGYHYTCLYRVRIHGHLL